MIALRLLNYILSVMLNQSSDLMLIDSVQPSNIRAVILDKNRRLKELFLENCNENSIKGNIYLGTVTRVEHSLQCAFVDFGGEKNGFLSFDDIHIDYYQIPSFDKSELIKNSRRRIANDGSNNVTEGSVHENGRTSELYKKYSIQEVIKRGQNVLVQVYKDGRGNKGASLTTYVSLVGRYCVFMPNSKGGFNISKRISDPLERKRILEIIHSFPVADGMSLVVRTAGSGISKEDLEKDFMSLATFWNQIREKTLHSKTQSLVYHDTDPIKQMIRDRYTTSVSKILVEGPKYHDALKIFKEIVPSEKNKVVEYKGKDPILLKYGAEKQIDELLDERVDLVSGGYLVINQTEALVAIDINSGRAIAEKDVESTALQINLEAAHEIARQLRLRDLGGLIVIDFIDMMHSSNRKNVENAFYKALEEDRAKTQIGRISIFGLLECSRQRLRQSLLDTVTIPCTNCSGMGRVRSGKFISDSIIRLLKSRNEIPNDSTIEVLCNSIIIPDLKAQEKESTFQKFIKDKNININIKEDSSASIGKFTIQEVKKVNDEIKYKVIEDNDISMYIASHIKDNDRSDEKYILPKRIYCLRNRKNNIFRMSFERIGNFIKLFS